MVKAIYLLLIIGWLIIDVKAVKAAVFTPESTPFFSDLDAAWEFPPVEEIAESTTEVAPLVYINFDSDWPNQLKKSGQVEILSEENESFLAINNHDSPSYLVQNKLSWQFTLTARQPVWLELDYRVWSMESAQGFDNPVLAIYHGNDLIYQEDVFKPCSINPETGVCEWQVQRWYLGELSGDQQISLFGGEMGDLGEASRVDIRSMSLLTPPAAVSPTPTSLPNLSPNSTSALFVSANLSSTVTPTPTTSPTSVISPSPTIIPESPTPTLIDSESATIAKQAGANWPILLIIVSTIGLIGRWLFKKLRRSKQA